MRYKRIRALIPDRLYFQWRYWRGQTPWDTNVTPPEVMEFLAGTTPGRALDLGCGTGTNAITLTRHGWKVTGVDFVPTAIRNACACSAPGCRDPGKAAWPSCRPRRWSNC